MQIFRKKISRREFILKGCLFAAGVGLSGFFFKNVFKKENSGVKEDTLFSREAMFYEKRKGNSVQCHLCFNNCLISEGQRGRCRNRENYQGTLYSIVYAKPSAVHIDPIEKEPALHMVPGTQILCFGTAGCNFRCKFCQNWHLSQQSLEQMSYQAILPEAAVALAIKKQIPTLSFTYNEPTTFYEYVYDTAQRAKEKGLKILWHSNGAMSPEPLRALLTFTDSVTIDLKGFTHEFYRTASQGSLDAVLRTIKIIKEEGRWLEIVNLHIPTLNDNPADVERMCLWIKENVGSDTPLHFSRFHPAYKLTNLHATPIETLEGAHRIAKKCGLEYVTIGNVPGHRYNSTFCPRCNNNIIHRRHFAVLANHVVDGKCTFCNHAIPGIWS